MVADRVVKIYSLCKYRDATTIEGKCRLVFFEISKMEISGKVHCFFEQSGTFKNEFKKLGYEAEDYDIQNNFGETDNVVDLFAEIESAYDGKPSLFDNIRGGGGLNNGVLSVYILLRRERAFI